MLNTSSTRGLSRNTITGDSDWLLIGRVMCVCDKDTLLGSWNIQVCDYHILTFLSKQGKKSFLVRELLIYSDREFHSNVH